MEGEWEYQKKVWGRVGKLQQKQVYYISTNNSGTTTPEGICISPTVQHRVLAGIFLPHPTPTPHPFFW